MITEEQYKQCEEVVRHFIQKHCIVKGNMPGKLPGTKYTWMFYLRNGLFNADFLQYVSEMMLYRIHQELGDYNFQICGAETAGTPIAAAMPLVAKTHGIRLGSFVVRKERKGYGLMNWHEGMAYNKIPYVLVDDLCNSSTSLAHAHNIASNALKLPSANLAVVIVNKSNKGVHDHRLHSDIYLPKEVKVISLFDLDTFDLDNPSH